RTRAEAAERERDHLRAGAGGGVEVAREIARETEKARADLERAEERRRAAEQTAATVLHDAASLRTEVEKLQAAGNAAAKETERLVGENLRLSQDLAARRQESKTALETLEREARELRVSLAETQDKRTALAAETETLRGELARRRASEEEIRSRGAAATD